MELFPGRSREERGAPRPKAHEPPGNKGRAGRGEGTSTGQEGSPVGYGLLERCVRISHF